MKAKPFGIFWGIIIFIFSFFLTSTSWGGQVVTEDTKIWARQVLKEEKSLQTAEQRNTVAVLYFNNKTGKSELDPMQKGLCLMLITDLSTVQGIQAVERTKLQALVEEMNLSVSGLTEADTSSRVGKLMSARWLVGGNIGENQPQQLVVASNVLDVPSTQILGQPTVQGRLPEMFRMEKDLLFDILKLLKIEPTPEEERRLNKPCSRSVDAAFLLFRGIDASDRGDYEAADDYYKKALKEDPDVCIAKDAIEELKTLGLTGQKKSSLDLLRSLRDRTSLTNELPEKEGVNRERTPKDVNTKTPVNVDIIFP